MSKSSKASASNVNNSAAVVTGRILGSLFRIGTSYTVAAAKSTMRASKDLAHGVREGARGEVI